MEMKLVNFLIPEDMRYKLKRKAVDENTTMSDLVRSAIQLILTPPNGKKSGASLTKVKASVPENATEFSL